MPYYLLVKDRVEGFIKTGNQSYRSVLRKIGPVTFFRDKLNVSKLPAKRIGRSNETQTKEFHQAVSDFLSTVLQNNRRDSIRTVSLPRMKVREPGKRHIKEF